MRRYLLPAVTSAFLSGSVALSQEAPTTTAPAATETSPEVTSTSIPTTQPQGERSSDIRARKSASVGGVVGFMYSLIPGAALEGYYHVNGDFHVGAYIGSGSLDLSDRAEDNEDDVIEDDVETETAEIKVTSFGAQVRWFAGNSFYLRGGLGYRIISTNIRVEDRFDSNTYIETKTQSGAATLDLGLGNIWTLPFGLYLGAEWFGVSIPFAGSSNDDTDSGGVPDEDMKELGEDNEDLADTFSKATTFRLATFQIGYSF